jgi:hypothetical protein
MKYREKLVVFLFAIILSGCAITRTKDQIDPRSPLINNDQFTNYVPTVITNKLSYYMEDLICF